MKVTHIIKTDSLQSDGRLLKWISSLKSNNIESDIFILELNNKKSESSYKGTQYKSTSLFFRKFFRQRKGYIFKVPEFTIKSLSFFRKSKTSVYVFHDMQHYLTLFILSIFKGLKKGKKIIWDLHELPHSIFFKFSINRKILKFILENTDMLVYTNQERREYMQERINYKEKAISILNNFPDKNFLIDKKKDVPETLKSLRSDKPYLLWLGMTSSGRNFDTFIKVFDKFKDVYNLVILGTVEDEFKDIIENYRADNIVYNSFVKQEEMINYIDNALFSVVLYKDIYPNNLYCEPNRLYQLISRNIPVIVGHNPTMKNVVEKTKSGIVLEDDGQDISHLTKSFEMMHDNIDVYKMNMERLNKIELFSWDEQFDDIVDKIKQL